MKNRLHELTLDTQILSASLLPLGLVIGVISALIL